MVTEESIQRIAKSYVNRLARTINIRQAILTGSWANGRYMEDSDVDIIVVSDDFANMELPARLQYLQKKWKSRIPLEAFGYTQREFRVLSKRSTYVRDAIRNGRSLLKQPSPTNPMPVRKSVLDLAGTLSLKDAGEIRSNVSRIRAGSRVRLGTIARKLHGS